MSAFGDNLRRLRKGRGLTQGALATLCGCRQGYISSLEVGAFSPSMRILEKLASALEVRPVDLLLTEADPEATEIGGEGIAIINERSRDRLPAPGVKRGKVSGDSDRVLCVPGLHALSAFASYLPDDSMAPAFGKGDLVGFSLSREAVDGDAWLVDTAGGEGVFRTVLAWKR